MFSCSGQHLLSEVRTSDQRSGRYAVEPHPACHPLDFCKLVRVPVPSHGKVVLRRLQVLPHGDHPAVCLSQITQQFLHLASVLPEPDHHTALCQHPRSCRACQHGKRSFIVRPRPHHRIKSSHRLHFVVENVRSSLDNRIDRLPFPLEVGHKDFNGRTRKRPTQSHDGSREVVRTTVRQIIPGQ